MRAGVFGEVRRIGVFVIASGTVVSGIGLLDTLVRPGTIERVETLGLLGVAGLIVLPPLTLMLGAMQPRRKSDGGAHGDASARVGVGVRTEVGRGTVRVPVVDSAEPGTLATRLAAAAMERRSARARRARAAATVRERSPRRAEAGALMSAVAVDLDPMPAAAVDAEGGSLVESAEMPRQRGRVMQHGGHRREMVRRRGALEMDAVVRTGGVDPSDSMLGFAVGPGVGLGVGGSVGSGGVTAG